MLEAEVVSHPRVVRQYSQQERMKALALYDNVGSLEKTAQTLGIPLSTLSGWVNDPNNYSELRNKTALDLAQKFEDAAHRFIDLARKKAKKAGFNHLMTGAGIAVDKMQLLRGQPTAITEQSNSTELLGLLRDALNAGVIDITPSGEDKEVRE